MQGTTAPFTPAPFPLDKVGIFRTGTWYLDVNGNGLWDAGTDRVVVWGQAGDTPVVGEVVGETKKAEGSWQQAAGSRQLAEGSWQGKAEIRRQRSGIRRGQKAEMQGGFGGTTG
jgi:hypothetical protein